MKCPECAQGFNQRGFRFCPYDGSRLIHQAATRGAASAEDEVGTILSGRYTIRRFVAKGAMARVFMADDEHTGQLVAVKILSQKFAKSHEVRERFLREAKAVSMIGHPNVIHIHEVAEREDGTPYMVMEFLRGESLGERFEVEPTVPRALALSTLVAVSDALWAAHQKGIVHRDIKPDNLFLIGDPKAPEGVRVLDFGLSRLFQSKLTASGTVIGTPGYMAPEQVVADPVDQRTDIYGLGMVMYRMFTGRLPFESGGEHGSDTASILARQLFATPPHPSTLADVDKQIERVIMRAIRKQPENRYPSMQLLANDLRKLVSGGEELEYVPERDKYELESTHSQMVAAGYRKLYDERS